MQHKLSRPSLARMRCQLRPAPALLLLTAAMLALVGCASPPPPPPPPAPVVTIKASQVIPIMQIDRGVLMLLPAEKVAFDFGKATVSSVDAHEFLDRMAAILKDKTSASMVLEGHTDSQGARPLNQKLSEDRAETIRQELSRRGVAVARMSAAGFAFDRPVAANDNEGGRKMNRRVELIVLGETVANITRGEPEGSFELAFARLKDMIDTQGLKPAKAP